MAAVVDLQNKARNTGQRFLFGVSLGVIPEPCLCNLSPAEINWVVMVSITDHTAYQTALWALYLQKEP